MVSSDSYRFGFNGMSNDTWFSSTESLSGVNPEWSFSGTSGEKDVEFKGQGNSYMTVFRQYDARVGKRSTAAESLDPLMAKFPWGMSWSEMFFNMKLPVSFKIEKEEKIR